MSPVTVKVPLDECRDIIEGDDRACVAFSSSGRPWVEPVDFQHAGGRFLVRFGDASSKPAEGAEVVLLVDEGVLFFDLRAVYVRGTVGPAFAEGKASRPWVEIQPAKLSSWDYGRMRVERGSD